MEQHIDGAEELLLKRRVMHQRCNAQNIYWTKDAPHRGAKDAWHQNFILPQMHF